MSNRVRYVTPSVKETAFSCPHCGALASQTWWMLHADQVDDEKRKPFVIVGEEVGEEYLKTTFPDDQDREEMRKWFAAMSSGAPFVDKRGSSTYVSFDLRNLNVAQCYNCSRVSVWVGADLAWPISGDAPEANSDLSADIRLDYDEASRILNLSPRGAAALLRLAIQKLCKELGCKGKTIDENIAELVKKGLDARIQRALDIVRVVGNEAVHPGQIDLRDDRATAEKLFGLVNIIAEKMISEPKAIDALYDGLPPSKLEAIERRDSVKP